MLPNFFIFAFGVLVACCGSIAYGSTTTNYNNRPQIALPHPPTKPSNCEPGSKCFQDAAGNFNPLRRPHYQPHHQKNNENQQTAHRNFDHAHGQGGNGHSRLKRETQNGGSQNGGDNGGRIGRTRRGSCNPNVCDSNCRYCFNGKCDCNHH